MIVRLLSPWKWRFAILLIIGISLNSAAAIAEPLLAKLLIDQISSRNLKLFTYAAVGMLAFGVIYRLGTCLNETLLQKLQNTITKHLTLRMLELFFMVQHRHLTGFTSGYFVSRIYDEPAQTATCAVATVSALCISLATLTAGLGVAFYLAPTITIVLLLIVPVLYWLSLRVNNTIAGVSKSEKEEEAKVREVLGKAVDSYKTVKIFDLYRPVRSRVTESIDSVLGALYLRVKTASGYKALSNIALSLAETVAFISAGYQAVVGKLSIGGVFGFIGAFWKVMTAANGLVRQIPELSKVRGYACRLRDFERLASESAEQHGGVFIDDSNVEFSRVSVKYDSCTAFEDLNLKIGASEKVLLMGPNGSGKTTIANVIARFTTPNNGVVRSPTRSRISALICPFYFIPGSLKDNVNYDELSTEKQQLFTELVKEFGLADKRDVGICSTFSEGEKKKCQMIMTLLKDADCYVFDEPLAHLDVESKERILRKTFQRAEGKALLVIMHGDEQFRTYFDRALSMTQLCGTTV